jgi:NADH-quinone oxidoreductase subunit N
MDLTTEMSLFLPAILTTIGGLAAMMMAAYKTDIQHVWTVSTGTVLLAFVISIRDLLGAEGLLFSGMVGYGGTAAFGTMVVLLGTFFTLLLSKSYLEKIHHHVAEVYSLILLGTTGMIVLASSMDLVATFVGLETMSVCLYVLAGLVKEEKRSIEAALKYFLLGAFSTGFFLYGIALLYGATQSTSLDVIGAATDKGLIYWGGVAFLLIGFFFKISAVPFHMWTPDVYQGSPTTITGYMATAAKTSAFVSLILILSRALQSSVGEWSTVFEIVAVLTMVFGNIIALVQHNVKRMLAYSSIAHAGYALVGLTAGTVAGYDGVLFYLFAYTLMNIGAFAVIAHYETTKGSEVSNLEHFAGLGFKKPALAVMLSIFLFSLAGIPPFAGFAGKYQVFAAAIEQEYVMMALIGVLTSAAAAFYYLRVMVYMYFRQPEFDIEPETPTNLYLGTIVVLALLTLYFGVNPGIIVNLF